eukprot:NODE_818_length_1166_cov_2071.513876_g575_i0.p1 GENE.NODE_818_length_1166_cov_2071.513876_g575_i0~~NODE_818_length_1166_cov_2071.513876_g575_i0.p1  ORF type:complete len:298 (-),score=162.38 NODE_818_length_1166_cov_2071.513876_g575_i0:148-1041(-)
MKINVASPVTGTQKLYDIEDIKILTQLNDKRLAQTFDAGILGPQFAGYQFKITGGQDKQGFPMKQGVLVNSRVHLLLPRGTLGFQAWRGRKGERQRKSVRGCIVGPDISILNVIIVKEGNEKLEGLNDHVVPRRLGPKRAGKIRKLFNLTSEDDVRKFVIRRYLPPKELKDGKMRRGRSKAPKIQRLVTPVTISRKKRKANLLKNKRAQSREERTAYQNMLDRRRIVSAHRKKARALVAMEKQKNAEKKKGRKDSYLARKAKRVELAKARKATKGSADKKAAPAKKAAAKKAAPKKK